MDIDIVIMYSQKKCYCSKLEYVTDQRNQEVFTKSWDIDISLSIYAAGYQPVHQLSETNLIHNYPI